MIGARNLLENAVLHSPANDPVHCSLRRDQRMLAVIIDDRGPGIPKDELPKVYDCFFRERNKTVSDELSHEWRGGDPSIARRQDFAIGSWRR
jgi:K+-sensing histidine kinase KdpD